MTHDYHRTAEAQREDDAEFGNDDRDPYVLPGAGMYLTAILALALLFGFALILTDAVGGSK